MPIPTQNGPYQNNPYGQPQNPGYAPMPYNQPGQYYPFLDPVGQPQTGFNYPGLQPYDQGQLALQQQLTDMFAQQRQQDLAKGLAAGKIEYAPGSLGRVSETTPQGTQDYLNQLKGFTGGYTDQAYQAIREKAMNDLNRSTQGSMQDLEAQQGKNRVYGDTATAQQAGLLRNRDLAAADVYRNLIIGDIGEKQQATQNYGQALTVEQQNELARQQFNLGQLAKEKQGQLAFEFGYGQLGSADRGAAQKFLAGQQQIAAAQANQPSGGGK